MSMIEGDLFIKSILQNGNYIIAHPNGNTFNKIVSNYITNPKEVTWREEQNLKKVREIEIIDNERQNMDTLLQIERERQEYSCVYIECDKLLTCGLLDLHVNESHKVTRIIRG